MRYEIDHEKKTVTFYIPSSFQGERGIEHSFRFSFDEFGMFFGILFLKMGGRPDLVKAVEAYTNIVGEISEYFKKHKFLAFNDFEKIYRKHRPNVLKKR